MDLLKRIISAVVLVAAVLLMLLCGKITTVIIASVACLLMMIDVSGAFKQGGFKPQRLILILTSLAVFPAVMFKGIEGYVLLSAVSFSIMAICLILSKEPDFKTLLSGVFSLIYPLMPASLLVLLTARDLTADDRSGTVLCIGAILCASLSDVFAYFFGKFFGKKKLCPQISPKKTIVGSIASFFGGALGGVIMHLIFKMPSTSVHMYDWILIGVACGGFAQIGDLTASMLKRFCNIKDFGRYIPGHGGLMDRMDSISACLIAIVVYVQIFVPEIL